jgi:hypothetical protein
MNGFMNSFMCGSVQVVAMANYSASLARLFRDVPNVRAPRPIPTPPLLTACRRSCCAQLSLRSTLCAQVSPLLVEDEYAILEKRSDWCLLPPAHPPPFRTGGTVLRWQCSPHPPTVPQSGWCPPPCLPYDRELGYAGNALPHASQPYKLHERLQSTLHAP